VNWSNINFGIVFKQGGLGDGPPISCMSFVVSDRAITIVLIRSKQSSEKEFQRSMGRRLKFGISSMSPRSNIRFGIASSFMLKWLGRG
jgi:hypothetical protein